MLRSVLSVLLLAAAGLPLAYALRHFDDDLRRAAAIAGVSVAAMLVCLWTLIRPQSAVKAYLKRLAMAMAILICAGSLGLSYYLQRVAIPGIERPQAERITPGLRSDSALDRQVIEMFDTISGRLAWLALALAVCAASIALLRTIPAKTPTRAGPSAE